MYVFSYLDFIIISIYNIHIRLGQKLVWRKYWYLGCSSHTVQWSTKERIQYLLPHLGKYFGIRGFKHPHSETLSGTLEAQACYVEALLPEKYFRSTATTLQNHRENYVLQYYGWEHCIPTLKHGRNLRTPYHCHLAGMFLQCLWRSFGFCSFHGNVQPPFLICFFSSTSFLFNICYFEFCFRLADSQHISSTMPCFRPKNLLGAVHIICNGSDKKKLVTFRSSSLGKTSMKKNVFFQALPE